jgi:hypothetical protein
VNKLFVRFTFEDVRVEIFYQIWVEIETGRKQYIHTQTYTHVSAMEAGFVTRILGIQQQDRTWTTCCTAYGEHAKLPYMARSAMSVTQCAK